MKRKSPAYFITPSVKVDDVSFSIDFVLSFAKKSDFINAAKSNYYLDHTSDDRKKMLGAVYDLAKKKQKNV